MQAGDVLAAIGRPAFSGTMRARKTKKRQHRVTKKQWAGYVAVAFVTTLLTQKLNDLVDRQFGNASRA